jgi:creatinine amidohydrolase
MYQLYPLGFAGSTSLRPSTLVNVICDVVWSLKQSSNFTHFYFINGHGGNVLPIKLAFAILKAKEMPPWLMPQHQPASANDNTVARKDYNYKKKSSVISDVCTLAVPEVTELNNTKNKLNSTISISPFKLSMVSWYANNESQSLARSLYGDELGQHATPDEVAMTKFLFPDLKKTAILDPEIIKSTPPGRTARRSEPDVDSIITGLLEGIADVDERNKIMYLGKMALNHMEPEDFRKRFADGRMWSNPGLATEEHGKLLFETSTKSVIENFKSFVSLKD